MSLRTAVADTRLIAQLLTIAESEARALGDPEPGAEHLLLAALLVDDGSGRDAIANATSSGTQAPASGTAVGATAVDATTVDATTVRTAIAAVHAASLSAIGVAAPDLDTALPPARGVYRSEVSGREVFQRARVLSKRSPSGLRSAHVVLAAAERERGTVARVLEYLGVDRVALVDAAEQAVS